MVWKGVLGGTGVSRLGAFERIGELMQFLQAINWLSVVETHGIVHGSVDCEASA